MAGLLNAVIAAWLNDSQSSRVNVVKRSAMQRVKCKAL